ncbi:TIGR03756 family integrating conjugative element protein [Pseudomonas sp. 21LCFQ010]|uniref:TIGR03756 family integrating conjugative element protein n=1 Tax=Pseudomonas sp. 21LCFQ010 TaxID=2957506 RepID=UPI002096B646|nr:TIGR03756 family integrating conjugative element protein [Pseudomonas sp. 21LCFQ010]MCO8163901.1 TIGR03756 family integrating conjugative element protein [Pseudomonas sp. 21LCFQ010]
MSLQSLHHLAKRALPLLLFASAPAWALTTAAIVPTVMSPTCMDYRVVGVCYWLFCTNFGCQVKTSAKVGHYVPDAVVSSYSTTGQNPWLEVRSLSAPTAGAHSGGAGINSEAHENNMAVFKNVDVIGHPGGEAFSSFASGSGYVCAGAGRAYVPSMLSTLDTLAWRHGIPESVFPQSLTPGLREVGNRLTATMWGSVYPRSGFLHQVDDYKASAVTAQRAGDVVTRMGQVHVYQPLLAMPSPGYWPAGELREGEIRTGKWQQLSPVTSPSCSAFPEVMPGLRMQSQDGGYAWALWRPYSCCKREGQTFLGSTGVY